MATGYDDPGALVHRKSKHYKARGASGCGMLPVLGCTDYPMEYSEDEFVSPTKAEGEVQGLNVRAVKTRSASLGGRQSQTTGPGTTRASQYSAATDTTIGASTYQFSEPLPLAAKENYHTSYVPGGQPISVPMLNKEGYQYTAYPWQFSDQRPRANAFEEEVVPAVENRSSSVYTSNKTASPNFTKPSPYDYNPYSSSTMEHEDPWSWVNKISTNFAFTEPSIFTSRDNDPSENPYLNPYLTPLQEQKTVSILQPHQPVFDTFTKPETSKYSEPNLSMYVSAPPQNPDPTQIHLTGVSDAYPPPPPESTGPIKTQALKTRSASLRSTGLASQPGDGSPMTKRSTPTSLSVPPRKVDPTRSAGSSPGKQNLNVSQWVRPSSQNHGKMKL